MKRGMNEIIGHSIITKDGTKGKIKDFLFDKDSWQVRYLEADFGNLFSNDRILIPKTLLMESHISDDDLHLNVTTSLVKLGPKPEEDLPISRQYEEKLNRYYNQEFYWAGPGYGVVETGMGQEYGETESAMTGSRYPRRIPRYSEVEDVEQSSNLHSFKEVKGYNIHATDGTLGSVDNLIIDDDSWQIGYIIVDTNSWLPWSKKVLIDISFIENINYEVREAEINLHTDSIKNAPEYDEKKPVDDQYESSLQNHYERSSVHH
jgi:sporulation protein YlmC with PRC-barrel domain